jgi:hypothetical protein
VLAKHFLVSRDFARPRELDADREPSAASLREKAAAGGLRVTGDVSFDVVHDYGGLPCGQRRAAVIPSARLAGQAQHGSQPSRPGQALSAGTVPGQERERGERGVGEGVLGGLGQEVAGGAGQLAGGGEGGGG